MEQITTKSLSKTGLLELVARYADATASERTEIRRQVERLSTAKATGHGGSARQAGAKRAILTNFDLIDA